METRRKLKWQSLMNTNKLRLRQTGTPGVTGVYIHRIIIDNETNTAGQELTHNHKKRGKETNQIRTQEAGTQEPHTTED